ncbi:hypothetical protein Neut_1483 [Nitrosomonas eutropha C91]|uniref:DNA-binding transcriptional regulator YdaS (Cro superfamily) n=2 Tax=Nitrosomonas eutropha TaxID=916 RepID=A0ABX5MBQ0_9PROT|nr:YdaS family helix-turn-helix protein [Nitrosomonas eutropha]ABI59728.1 hypothetical protein Neut_1483 [Nitrosomonas eutropha C91]PXV82472.1 DNA-binding transcriptional regulator YdaS (Cro superfamily) [Nitrosomonas eutropha]
MELIEYIKKLSISDRNDFAVCCETSFAHLRNIAYGYRRAGELLCINIERESGGLVKCETLRPDVDWGYLRNSRPQTKPIQEQS